MSMVSMMSLTPIGMPSIGESGFPARQRSVERSAAARAPARLSATKAPIFGSQASSSAMQRSRNWRGESFPFAKFAVAGRNGRIRGGAASGVFMGSLLLLALRPILASPGVGIARSNEAVIASEAKRSRGRTARYVPWIASSLTLLATPIAVLLLALFIPHSEGRAKRGVSKNGSGACAGRPSRRAFGAPQDDVGG